MNQGTQLTRKLVEERLAEVSELLDDPGQIEESEEAMVALDVVAELCRHWLATQNVANQQQALRALVEERDQRLAELRTALEVNEGVHAKLSLELDRHHVALRKCAGALTDAAQLVDAIKAEWQSTNDWSEWDQHTRKKLTDAIKVANYLIFPNQNPKEDQ